MAVKCHRCGYRWIARVARPVRCASCRSPYWNQPRRRRSTAAVRLRRYVQIQSAVHRVIEQDASPKERLQSFWVMLQQQARWDAVRGIDALCRWREEKARAQRET